MNTMMILMTLAELSLEVKTAICVPILMGGSALFFFFQEKRAERKEAKIREFNKKVNKDK